MSYRLPVLADAAMSAEQRRVADTIKSGPRGVVQGPLAVWLHSADLADRAQSLGAFCRFGTSLPPRLSELAIITTGAFWQAGFEWHVHAPIGERAGLDPAAIETLRTGGTPHWANEDEQAVWRFTHHLLHDKAVPDAAYATVERMLGTKGTVELVGIIGYYGLICATIKAFGVPVPAGETEPFEPALS
jgi:4-carboxymuconolactone decarboxylase